MKLAKEITEELDKAVCLSHYRNRDEWLELMSKAERIIAMKLEPVRKMFKDLIRVSGELSHYPTYGVDIGAHPVNKRVTEAKDEWWCMEQRIEAVIAMLSEEK